MIGASKILTVSYGTFSCTLEGFDDPFNTMRAIAEYFRDLAAEDRYFGAEPPTPDAAMLLKIAEREVQRRVEAKIQDNGVVLRTGEAMQAPAPVPSPQPQPAVVTTAPAPEPAPMPEGVAAKLLRIRAAVANAELAEPRRAEAPAPTPVAPAQPILADYSEDEHADEIAAATPAPATFAPEAFDDAGTSADDWSMPDAVTPDADPDTAIEDAVLTETARPDAEPVAAQNAEDPAIIDMSEDAEFAWEDFSIPAADASTAQDAEDTMLASIASQTVDLAPPAPAAPEAPAEIVADAEIEAFDTVEDYDVNEDDLADLRALDGDATPDAASDEQDYDEDYADIVAQPAEDLSLTDLELDAPATADPVIEEIDSAYDAPDDVIPSRASEKALRARARVIKVRRDDAVEDTANNSAEDQSAATEAATRLAADAEADLRRDLRALQQQSATAAPVQDLQNQDLHNDDDETDPEDDPRHRLDDAGEAAVSRLIEQTNEAMAVPENRRRLSAIAHLKAAVAATVAERFAKGGSPMKEAETKRLDPYRDDLARVVRPQNQTGTEDASATARPAPLVLVSAQRIDRPRAAPGDNTTPLAAVPNAPVRPRRVTSAALAVDPTPEIDDDEDETDAANLFTDTRGFAEFSERLGANSLAEILEAAAAYSVCIEGRPYFSRPQLMSQIGALSADSEYTREDGLRTFGTLLREGRIQKIKRGQFVLTESSRYLAEARTLAG